MFKRIDHVEVVPRDFDRALGFYTEVLGFKVKSRQKVEAPPLEEVAYLELGETVLELMRVKAGLQTAATAEEWRPGYRMIALEVEDMDQAVAYLTDKGVALTWGPMALGKAKRAEIKDSEGNSIELRQW